MLLVNIFDEVHKDLITCCERVVVQHHLLEHGFFIHRGGGEGIEVPFKGLDISDCQEGDLVYLDGKQNLLLQI